MSIISIKNMESGYYNYRIMQTVLILPLQLS